ncbi:MAG: hypothetical protein M5U31_15165 [Acidimicrobiia bacterium]|nr:hypothetical protein [Acidimicrobiia bacterium]
MTDTWDTANPGQPARPTGSTVGAMISAISGLLLLGVSFLPWIQVRSGLFELEGDANAWEQTDAGLTIAAVLIGVGIAAASAVIVYLAASTSNPPSRGARLSIGIVAIVGGVFIFFLSAARVASLNDTPFGEVDIYEPGVGMMLGWLASAGFVAGASSRS